MYELLRDSKITDRWSELVHQEYPEVCEQARQAHFAKYAVRAESLCTAEAYFDYGYELRKLDEFELAIEQFDRTLKLEPGYDDAHLNLGKCYENLDQYDEALKHYRAELLVDPRDNHVPYRIGRTALKAKRYAEAIPALRKAIAINNNSRKHQLLGQALTGIGKIKEAIAEFELSLKFDPSNKTAQWELERLTATQ